MERLPHQSNSLPQINEYMIDAYALDVLAETQEVHFPRIIEAMNEENPFLVSTLKKLYFSLEYPVEISGFYVSFCAFIYRQLQYPSEPNGPWHPLPVLKSEDGEFIDTLVADDAPVADKLVGASDGIIRENPHLISLVDGNLNAMNIQNEQLEEMVKDVVFVGVISMCELLRRAA